MPKGIKGFQKGYKQTEEHKTKIGNALRGKPKSEEHRINIGLARLGKKSTNEQRKKQSELMKKHPNSGQFRKGIIPWNKNKKLPQFSKEKSAMFGKHHTEESKKKMGCRMENHPRWKDGISKKRNYKRMKKLEYQGRKIKNGGSHTKEDWELLKKNYNYTCLCCKRIEPEIKLSEDHIIPLIKGGSDNINNIQPLCISCNFKKHTKIINYLTLGGVRK